MTTTWSRRWRATVRGGLALGLLGGALPGAAGATGAAPGRGAARPFHLYLGQEPRHVRSSSRVSGAKSRHVLGPVLQGDVVEHTFRIPNPGPEPMEITDVAMCSGCILGGYTREIPPGREGSLSLVVTTDWLGGGGISSPIVLETRSEAMPRIEIQVSLHVREFAALHPYRIWLKGPPHPPLVETCLVVPNEDYPFSITGIKARKGIWFEHSWREVERDGRRAYEITVRNTRERPGPYQDVLFVQTDHPERPELKIRVEGRIGE